MNNETQDRELVIEVRIKWDDLMSKDELSMLSMFSDRAESAIKRKVVAEVAQRIVVELTMPEFDREEIKQLIKEEIVNRKVDEIL